MSTNTAALLQELTAVTGTPFSDEKVLNLLTAKLASFGDVQVDAMHNISCTFGRVTMWCWRPTGMKFAL